jgi:ketosteroid isomerase-like protein
MVLGTPAYMSCEQASGMRSDELDVRSDIYSLGVVVYEMLSGRVPFHSDTPLGYLRKHMLEEPPPFRAIGEGLHVPPQVEAVVMKALKKERDERYQSALEFAQAFLAAAQPTLTAEVSQPLPSTKVVSPPAVREPAAPMPVFASTPVSANTAVQTPPPAPPERIRESPSTQQEGDKPVAAPSPPAASRGPQFQAATESPSLVKYAAMGLVLLTVIAVGIWYFSHLGPEPSPHITSPSPSATVPAGQEARVEAPAAELGPTPRNQSNSPSPVESTQVANEASGQPSESDASVRDAVGAWVLAFRSKDLTALADSYAPLVEIYFRRTNVSHEEVRQYIESTFAKMVDIRKYEVNDLRVGMVPGDNSSNGINYSRATATFRKTWDTLESDGKSFSGEEIEQLTFTSSPQGWKIIREEELKIIRASRH